MKESALDTLTQRLDRLEKENRWLKRVGTLAIIGLAAVVFMGQAARPQATKQAERFVLRDAGGKARGEWVAEADGAGLTINDQDGKPRASLSTTFHKYYDVL